MTTPLTMSTHQRPDGTWVLTVAGEIDMSNARASGPPWPRPEPVTAPWSST